MLGLDWRGRLFFSSNLTTSCSFKKLNIFRQEVLHISEAAVTLLVFPSNISTLDRMNAADEAAEWKGAELFVCAILQLILVFIAYRLDCLRDPTAISESAWAIFFGLLVCTQQKIEVLLGMIIGSS